jgi:hypothetical protein
MTHYYLAMHEKLNPKEITYSPLLLVRFDESSCNDKRGKCSVVQRVLKYNIFMLNFCYFDLCEFNFLINSELFNYFY